MLLILLVACATTHSGPKGAEYEMVSGPYGARLLMDGGTAASAVEAADDDTPVRVVTEIRDGRRSSTTRIEVGATYEQPVYASGLDPELAAAVEFSAMQRADWSRRYNAVPGARDTVYMSAPPAAQRAPASSSRTTSGSSSGGSQTVSLGQVVVTQKDLSVKCPSMGPEGRAPRNAAELLACQTAFDQSVRAAAVEVK